MKNKTQRKFFSGNKGQGNIFFTTSFIVYSLALFTPITVRAGSLLNHGLFDDTDTAPQALEKILTRISPIMYSLTLIIMILGAVTMFTSVGNPERFKKGKSLVIQGFMGALMFSAFWLILSFMGINFK